MNISEVEVREVHGNLIYFCFAIVVIPFQDKPLNNRNYYGMDSEKGSVSTAGNPKKYSEAFLKHYQKVTPCTTILLNATILAKIFNFEQTICRLQNYSSAWKPENKPAKTQSASRHLQLKFLLASD